MKEDNKNLTARSMKAAGLVFFFQIPAQLFQIVLAIFLIRVLSPYDYGLIGMLAIFWGVCNVFIDGGFVQALLQTKKISSIDLSSVFFYNLFLSFFFCFLMIGIAPYIAAFYGEDILIRTIRLTAWTLPITAVGAVPKVILGRNLMQGKISVSQLAGNVVSGIATLWLAYQGYGIWALVWQNFLGVLVSTLCIIFFVRWIPKWEFSFKVLWKHFKYGSKLLASKLLNTFFAYVYHVAIGKRFNETQVLGYYEQGRRYANKIPTSVQNAIDSVLFPAFSKIQDDTPRLRAAYVRALKISALAFIFCNLLIFTLCRPAVEIVLTDKWLPAVPYCRLLSLAIFFFPIQVLGLDLINSRGKSGRTLWLNIVEKTFVLVNVAILFIWNLDVMLFTNIIFSWFYAFLCSLCIAKELQYSILTQLKDILVYLVLTGLTCAAAWGIYVSLWPVNEILSLSLAFIAAVVLYAALNIILKTAAWSEIAALLKGKFRRNHGVQNCRGD